MSNLINITVIDKIAKLSNKSSKIVCNNSDYKAVFYFDKVWDNFPIKTAIIEYGNVRVARVFTGNECDLPPIINARVAKIGVVAGDLHTTTPAMVECDKSILDDGSLPEPTPDVYTQIMELLNSGAFKGDNYVLTEADKTEIAHKTAELMFEEEILKAIGSGVLV